MSKFHINKHGVPAPCRATKGNCPLGGASGNENHFDTQEEAQEYVDSENEGKYGLLSSVTQDVDELEPGNYVGNYHEISKHANENLRQHLTTENINQVLSDGFKDGDVNFEYEAGYLDDSPVKFNANISRVGDNQYRVTGELREHSYVERDFDTKEDYEEYMEGEPDGVHSVDYEFTGDKLRDRLIESGHMREGGGTNEHQSAGTLLYGVYRLTRDKID